MRKKQGHAATPPTGDDLCRPFDLDSERYISLATFRRDGSKVAVPVWFARHGDARYVFTEAASYKVKRLRRNPRIEVAPCDIRGRVRGAWREGSARILEEAADSAIIEAAYGALHAKYGWQMWVADTLSRLSGRIHGRAMLELHL